MNLEESNKINEKNTKKKIIIFGIALCVIAVIICIIIIFALNQAENNRFKMLVNNKEVSMSQNFITQDEQKNKYVNLKQIAEYTGYKYNKGDYIEVNEDKNSCFIENDYEIVSFKVDQNSFTKYIKNEQTLKNDENKEAKDTKQSDFKDEKKLNYDVKSKNKEKEIFNIDLPIILVNEEIYIPIDLVKLTCNSMISLTEKRLDIKSLDYLVEKSLKLAANLGYKSLSSTYENVRAISNNVLIVGDGNKYGAVNLNDGKEILGTKYDDIKYIQSQNKFYIYVDSKVGLLDKDGATIISPKNYETIELFDADKNLYLVKEDGKFGLLNFDGSIILHSDYDQIGINNLDKFKLNLSNDNLWHDKIVAIKQGSVWGLYNIERKEIILDLDYDGFGYITKTTDTLGEESVLLIPKETGVEGVVVIKDDNYGIVDTKIQELTIPCACSRIYSVTNNGNKKYYMEFAGQQLEMKEYFESHNKVTVKD